MRLPISSFDYHDMHLKSTWVIKLSDPTYWEAMLCSAHPAGPQSPPEHKHERALLPAFTQERLSPACPGDTWLVYPSDGIGPDADGFPEWFDPLGFYPQEPDPIILIISSVPENLSMLWPCSKSSGMKRGIFWATWTALQAAFSQNRKRRHSPRLWDWGQSGISDASIIVSCPILPVGLGLSNDGKMDVWKTVGINVWK